VLRAILWVAWKDRNRAAIAAARAGRVFGYVLAAYGFLQVMMGASFGGLWLVLIGLFLVSAAHAEEEQTRLGASLRGVLVDHVMTAHPVIADPEQTVEQFIQHIAFTHRFSAYPLTDPAGRLTGLVTLNRVRAVPPARRAVTRLREIACQADQVPTGHPGEPLVDLLPRMAGCADGRGVITGADGTVVGIVSPSDISRAIQLAGLRPRQQ
jgi:CBS domain-containing protein